jgi:phage terminase large subunit
MQRHASTIEMTRAVVAQAAKSRVFFVKNLLGAKPDPWQTEVLEALDRGDTRISIRSGHGVGKTALCAWCALHYLLFRFGVKVVVTSPSGRQMTDGLKPEIHLWMERLPKGMGLKEDLETTADRIVRKSDAKNNFISFRTARMETPEALAGIHADHVMVIVDEASGVPEVVYEAAAGTLSTAGSICLLIGNPTRARGLFYRTQTALTDHWTCFKVSSTESPRVDQAFIEDIRKTYGIDSNQFRVRVLGEFPTSEEDMVIPYELVSSAVGRDITMLPDSTVYWGIDPGRGGDATGFCARNGSHVLQLAEWHFPDLMRTVGKAKSHWDDTAPSERPESIYVDSIGLGAGVADRLREMGLPVIDVNVSEAPSMRERFPRLRAEVWFQARAWFEGRNVCINRLPLAQQLVDELSSVEMRLLSNGKTDVETKDDMRKRGLKSPNLADALNLTFAYQGAVQSGRSFAVAPWNKPIRSRYVGVA